MFGMNGGELGRVIFIVLLVWSAQIVPTIGARLGEKLAKKKA